MSININHTGGDSTDVPVRRRNPAGEFESMSLSVPKELAQKINGIVVSSKLSRSLVISQLLREAFDARERK